MKKLFFLLLVVFSLPLLAQNEELFEQGNTAYNQGDYTIAINRYEQILENGETSAALYYNLANAHFKINNLAPAIYHYEKALQLAPNDEDIRNNLVIARNMTIDDVGEEQSSGVAAIWNNTVSVLGYNEWAWVAVSFSVIFAILFLLYYYSTRTLLKRVYLPLSFLAALFVILSVIFAHQQKNFYSNNNYAVIFNDQVIVRGEPTQRANEIFVLHEGTKVEVLETYQDWLKFSLPNGAQGWIEKNAVQFF